MHIQKEEVEEEEKEGERKKQTAALWSVRYTASTARMGQLLGGVRKLLHHQTLWP